MLNEEHEIMACRDFKPKATKPVAANSYRLCIRLDRPIFCGLQARYDYYLVI